MTSQREWMCPEGHLFFATLLEPRGDVGTSPSGSLLNSETFAGRRLWGPGLKVWLEGSALGSAKEPGGPPPGSPLLLVLHRAAPAAHRA